MSSPILTIIGGANGSGKSTFIRKHFPDALSNGSLINADNIAQSINPLNNTAASIKAARVAIEKRNSFIIDTKTSFIVETTLASRTLLRSIKTARKNGFFIILHYLWVTMPTLCDFRVKHRVSRGGHDIDLGIILRRYYFSLEMLNQYIDATDETHIYIADELPDLIARKDSSGMHIISQNDWLKLQNDTINLKNRTLA